MLNQQWEYRNPVRIHSGVGSICELPNLLPAAGEVLLVTSAGWIKRKPFDQVCKLIGNDRLRVYSDVKPNPELQSLDLAITSMSRVAPVAVVGLGGGSVLDAAKVLAAGFSCSVKNPLHSIFREGLAHTWRTDIPVIAIPTTAGTGSEVTPYATVWDSKTERKFSVSGDAIFPVHALLDGNLTASLPQKTTLNTALDATSHALESLWNVNRSPVSQAFASQALSLLRANLPKVLVSPGDVATRTRLLEASALAGLAISQTKTALAHSVSYPLTCLLYTSPSPRDS